jgi:hypothetical protein
MPTKIYKPEEIVAKLRQFDAWFQHYNRVHPHKRWATARRASSGQLTVQKIPTGRRGASTACTPATEAIESGPKPPQRWRPAPALTRARLWITPNNYSVIGYSRATC